METETARCGWAWKTVSAASIQRRTGSPITGLFQIIRPAWQIGSGSFIRIVPARCGPGTWGGALIRFDDKAKTFVTYTPDSRDPHRLNGGGITTIHEDRAGTLWVGAFDGLYRYDRRTERSPATRKARACRAAAFGAFVEDRIGRLWLSTQKGVSRFDPRRRRSETTTCPTACRAMSSVTAVFRARMGRYSLAAAMGLMHSSLKTSGTTPTCRRS